LKTFEDYDTEREENVIPAFNKYDADNSGAIDKEELAALSKELGHELTEEELDTALKDLDLNGDGVIDLKEFSRWWFTGKKEFNGSRRAVL
jgi:Ca2+-binding EF-hand superfamily protein